jgi:ankyrin repeat protein
MVEPKAELSLTPLSLAALAGHADVAKFLSNYTGNAKALDKVRWQSGEAQSDACGETLRY